MTGTIQTGIDLLPATGAEVKLLDGTYNIESSITLDSYQTLRGCGRNTILTTTTANLDIITATGGSGTEKIGILITDLCVDGNAGGVANDIGIYWDYVDHSKIINVGAIDNGEDGIYLSECDDNIIIANTCNDNTKHGIYAWGNRIILSENNCNGNTENGIYIDTTYDSTFHGNICMNNTQYGIRICSLYGGSVTQNTCSKNTLSGIRGAFEECNLSGNICNYNGQHGFNITSGIDGSMVWNTCIGNSQTTTNTYDDILVASLEYCLISNNVCRAGGETNKPRYGINISNAACNGNKVINNDLYDDGFGTGAYNNDGTGTIYVEPGIDDTPVNGETGQPISSNWAYDHNADTTAHNALIWAIVFGG